MPLPAGTTVVLLEEPGGRVLVPEAPLPVVPEVPEVPLVAPGAGVLDGTEVEVPVPPTMPASLPVPAPDAPVAFCAGTEFDGTASPAPLALLPLLMPLELPLLMPEP